MDHLVTAAKPKDPRDLRRFASDDAGGIHVGGGDDAAGDLGTVPGEYADGVAAVEASARRGDARGRSEEHTSELQSPCNFVCRLLLERKKRQAQSAHATSTRA